MTTPTPTPAAGRFDEPVTPQVLARAIARGRQPGAPTATALPDRATTARYDPATDALLIGFADRAGLVLPVDHYPELAALDRAELAGLSLGFAGRALCLEARDLHVSIEGLMAASAPLMALASRAVATQNGLRRTAAKARAARENGLKGGRPRAPTAAAPAARSTP